MSVSTSGGGSSRAFPRASFRGKAKGYRPRVRPAAISHILATARVLRNVITVEVGKEEWIAVPLPTLKGRIAGALSALFSTRYTLFGPGGDPREALSNVSYLPLKDDILVQVGEQKWQTRSTTFGPSKITYEGVEYTVYEKITGRFYFAVGETLVAEGHTRFRSVVVEKYPPKIELFMASMAVGILIRTLFGELGV